jgi:hypothetical protein
VFVDISKQFYNGGSSYFKNYADSETLRNLYDIATGSDFHNIPYLCLETSPLWGSSSTLRHTALGRIPLDE